MDYQPRIILAITIVGLLLATSALAADSKQRTALFTLSLYVAFEEKPATTDTEADDVLAMTAHGSIGSMPDKLHISVTDETSMEDVNVIVNFKEGTLTMLYPDTLNGVMYDIKEFDEAKGFEAIHDVFMGRDATLPEGWYASAQQVLIADDKAMQHTATHEEQQVDWWLSANGVPLKAQIYTGRITVDVEITDFKLSDEVDSALFEIPADYTITEGEGAPRDLPAL